MYNWLIKVYHHQSHQYLPDEYSELGDLMNNLKAM